MKSIATKITQLVRAHQAKKRTVAPLSPEYHLTIWIMKYPGCGTDCTTSKLQKRNIICNQSLSWFPTVISYSDGQCNVTTMALDVVLTANVAKSMQVCLHINQWFKFLKILAINTDTITMLIPNSWYSCTQQTLMFHYCGTVPLINIPFLKDNENGKCRKLLVKCPQNRTETMYYLPTNASKLLVSPEGGCHHSDDRC